MANQEVEQKTTPVSEPELVSALISGANRLFGTTLTKPQVSVLVAHINLETGSSGAGWQGGSVGNTSMHNYNFGNIQWTPGSGHDYFVGGDRTKDANGKWIGTHYKFLAFPTLEDGAAYYLKFIHNSRGGKVWNAALEADPSAFSRELKHSGYYEEDESKYESAMNARLKNFNKGTSYEAALSGSFPSSSKPKSLDDILNQFLSALSTNESHYLKKKAIKQLLPNKYRLVINADTTKAIKLARVLCAAIDQKLYEDASIHTNGKSVEVQTTIHGDAPLCTAALLELSDILAIAFDTKIEIHPSSHSKYNEINLTAALNNFDKIRKVS